MSDIDRLFDELCCCGDDHEVKDGGSNLNFVSLRKLAKWPYLAQINFLIPESERYPLATAVVCDRCLQEGRGIKYAMAGEPGLDGKAHYYRVSIDELEEPEFYWPDHPPDMRPLPIILANGKSVEATMEEIGDFITVEPRIPFPHPHWCHSELLSELEVLTFLAGQSTEDELRQVARYILVYTENLSFTAYLFAKSEGKPDHTKEFNMPALKRLRELYQKVRDNSYATLDLYHLVHEMENICSEIGADPL